ncbi:MAG TPA: hypothetical protein VGP46_12280, partial [Acidimicrobiales bacterium]|nr:hypothetical protein [Acidimicrobiales bacterium]
MNTPRIVVTRGIPEAAIARLEQTAGGIRKVVNETPLAIGVKLLSAKGELEHGMFELWVTHETG